MRRSLPYPRRREADPEPQDLRIRDIELLQGTESISAKLPTQPAHTRFEFFKEGELLLRLPASLQAERNRGRHHVFLVVEDSCCTRYGIFSTREKAICAATNECRGTPQPTPAIRQPASDSAWGA